MRPCDCKDAMDTAKLQEQGIQHNDDSLVVTPNYVTLKLGHVTLTMSMHRFKQFAEWYLTNQEEHELKKCKHGVPLNSGCVVCDYEQNLKRAGDTCTKHGVSNCYKCRCLGEPLKELEGLGDQPMMNPPN